MGRDRAATRTAAVAGLLTAVIVTLVGVSPGQASTDGASGLPEGGPSVLYEPPPAAPQLENRDPRFRAPYTLVSGTERYADGEYLYTDFLYDDEDTTYPEEFERYGGNAADLLEFRLAVADDELAFRFSFTTLLEADSTIATVAFDSDGDATTGSSTLPRDPGLPFPGTDHVLTTWGTGSEWSSWDGTGWTTTPLEVTTDLEANQVTVTVPDTLARPTGEWTATLATGVHDPATGGWLDVESAHGSAIVNLGFRFDEAVPTPRVTEVLADGARDAIPFRGQRAALEAGTPTAYAHVIDFDLLRSGGERDTIPATGVMYRMFPSRLLTVDVITEPSIGSYERTPRSEGKDLSSLGAQYLSPLQPYGLYVPSTYDPTTPTPLTFALHGLDADYFWVFGNANRTAQLGEDRDSIVLSPSARGRGGFYLREMEHDIFEAWNDTARHFTLDPRRTAITGLSMGGYGTYRLGLLYPHLFSRAVPIIPAIMNGIWIPGVTDDETVANRWVDNARNLPFFHIADAASETTFYPGQLQQVAGPAVGGFSSLDALDYRYRLWSVAADHALLVLMASFPEITEFLADHEIEPEPFHVTYARMPSTDAPDLGLVHDRAYWVSDIRLRDEEDPPGTPPLTGPVGPVSLAKGVIDVVSLGFGKADPTSSVDHRAGQTADGLAYVEQERTWDEPGTVPVENRLVIDATNIAAISIDPVTARVDCDVVLDITSDGPLEVRLLGCPEAPASPGSGSEPPVATPIDTRALPATGIATAAPALAFLILALALTAVGRPS
jgi:hypothetical protein